MCDNERDSREDRERPLARQILNYMNYHSWAIRMKRFLQKKDVWEAVEVYKDEQDTNDDGTSKVDTDGNPVYKEPTAEVLAQRRKANRIALSEIADAANEEMLDKIEDKDNASEAWAKLAAVNTDMDIIYEILFLEDLQVKKDQGMSAGDYVKKIMELNRKVKPCLDFNFTERALAGIAVAGLSKDYDMIIAGMDKTKFSLGLSYVKNAIKEEDMKREKDEKEEDKAMALAARRNKKHEDTEGPSRGYQQGRKCQDEDCHQEEKREYFCFACGGRNHVAKYCKKKHRSSRQSDPERRYKKEEPSRRDENRHQEERHRHENKSQRESSTLARAKEEERMQSHLCQERT